MNKIHVKTGDSVVILSGKDKGKRGNVLAVSPKEGKLIVEGCNMATKSIKPRRQGEAGGIVKAEAAMYSSKVALYCPKCSRGVRYGVKVDDEGNKIRVCRRCGSEIK